MSYGPPPKTRYGDEDFIKEDFNPQQPSTDRPGYSGASRDPDYARSLGNLPTQSQPPIYGGSQSVNPGAATAQGRLMPQAVVEASKSLTQEDILFMRSWRQDSFYYRVLPLTTVASGALYYYNQSKGLPQKASRYFILSIACYAIGKWSYRDEFRRRLETNSSTTPYMQALRNLLGVKPIAINDGLVSDDFAYGDTTQYDQPINRSPGSITTNLDTNFTLPNNPSDGATPTTSYEELRARNRGHVPR